MMKPKLLCLASLILATGCAGTEKRLPETVEPGAVALVPARHAPAAFTETHSEAAARRENRAGQWAGSGAKYGFAVPALAAVHMPLLLQFLPIVLPVTMVGGAVVGGLSGAVSASLSTQRLPEDQAAPLADMVAVSVDERLQAAVASCVQRVRLLATEDVPPRVALDIELLVRAVPPGGERESWTREFAYRGDHRDSAEWRDEDGRVMATELDKACHEMAGRIVYVIFGATTPEEAS